MNRLGGGGLNDGAMLSQTEKKSYGFRATNVIF